MNPLYCRVCGARLKSIPLVEWDAQLGDVVRPFDPYTGDRVYQFVCSVCDCHTVGHDWTIYRKGWFGKTVDRCTKCGKTRPHTDVLY